MDEKQKYMHKIKTQLNTPTIYHNKPVAQVNNAHDPLPAVVCGEGSLRVEVHTVGEHRHDVDHAIDPKVRCLAPFLASSINQSINQSINESMNQSINQSIVK